MSALSPDNTAFVSIAEAQRQAVAEGKRRAAEELREAALDACVSCRLGWPLTRNRFDRWVHPEPPPAFSFPGDGPPAEWYCDAPRLHTRIAELEA